MIKALKRMKMVHDTEELQLFKVQQENDNLNKENEILHNNIRVHLQVRELYFKNIYNNIYIYIYIYIYRYRFIYIISINQYVVCEYI